MLRKTHAKYNLLFAAARDEQEVRKSIQRMYHCKSDEQWKDSILRIRAQHLSWVDEQELSGTLSAQQAARMRRCSCPNSTLNKDCRRYCRHRSCPWCYYRLLLATFRSLWHNLAEPEYQARCAKGKTRRGMKKRLVLGQVKFTLPKSVSIATAINTIIKERMVRKITRASEIAGGVACVNIDEQKKKTVIRVGVLGMTTKAVQHIKPRLQSHLDPIVVLLNSIPPNATVEEVEAAANDISQIKVETTWKANVSGYDNPKFGPGSLLKLLVLAMPRTRDATGIAINRFQPLGNCKQYLSSRMEMPKPIRYRQYRTKMVEVPAKQDDKRKGRIQKITESQLLKVRAIEDSGFDVEAALTDLDNDFSSSFRYMISKRAGCEHIAQRFREDALQELRRDKDLLDVVKPLLSPEFVDEVYEKMGKWRDKPEVREVIRYKRNLWYEDDDCKEKRQDQLARAILKRIVWFCGRKLGCDKGLVDMAIGYNVKKQRELWQHSGNPHGYFDLNDVVLPRAGFPRYLIPASLPDFTLDPLDAIDGQLAPPQIGGAGWKLLVSILEEENNPEACLVIRPPGQNRGLDVIHRDREAADMGQSQRINGTCCFLQPFNQYMEYCWTIWNQRPTSKTDLFSWSNQVVH